MLLLKVILGVNTARAHPLVTGIRRCLCYVLVHASGSETGTCKDKNQNTQYLFLQLNNGVSIRVDH